jgi:hypothetical protein
VRPFSGPLPVAWVLPAGFHFGASQFVHVDAQKLATRGVRKNKAAVFGTGCGQAIGSVARRHGED